MGHQGGWSDWGISVCAVSLEGLEGVNNEETEGEEGQEGGDHEDGLVGLVGLVRSHIGSDCRDPRGGGVSPICEDVIGGWSGHGED